MVLKKWKKTRATENHMYFWTSGDHISIDKLRDKLGWQFSSTKEVKKFKSKIQALAYAKKYMKKR